MYKVLAKGFSKNDDLIPHMKVSTILKGVLRFVDSFGLFPI